MRDERTYAKGHNMTERRKDNGANDGCSSPWSGSTDPPGFQVCMLLLAVM